MACFNQPTDLLRSTTAVDSNARGEQAGEDMRAAEMLQTAAGAHELAVEEDCHGGHGALQVPPLGGILHLEDIRQLRNMGSAADKETGLAVENVSELESESESDGLEPGRAGRTVHQLSPRDAYSSGAAVTMLQVVAADTCRDLEADTCPSAPDGTEGRLMCEERVQSRLEIDCETIQITCSPGGAETMTVRNMAIIDAAGLVTPPAVD